MNRVSLIPKASDALMMRKASNAMAVAESGLLTRESAMKSAAAGSSSHTTYKYEIGPDGRRYIVGAEISFTAPEGELDGIPGIKTTGVSSGTPSLDRLKNSASASSGNAASENETARLMQTEREVIAHENAHKAAAGRFGGPVHYTYTAGPDGRRYITGGEVSIHTPATSDMKEALRNARQVMSAALAPGDPSGQDLSVAASAAAAASNAMARTGAEEREDGEKSAAKKLSAKIIRGYEDNKSPRGLWSKTLGFEALGIQNESGHSGVYMIESIG